MRMGRIGISIVMACLLGMPLAYGQGTTLETGGNGPDTTCPEFMGLEQSVQLELLGGIQAEEDGPATAEAIEAQAKSVMDACNDDDKLTVGQALEQIAAKP